MRMKQIITVCVALMLAVPTFAQKGFEGTITFDIEYKDLPAEMAAMEAMLPDEMTTKIKGEKTRLEQSLGMGMSQVTITDMKKGSGTLLMNMMGKKMAVSMSKEELEKMDKDKKGEKKPEFKYVDGTKEIAGYDCKKAIVSIEGAGEMEVYYTEELPADANKQYEGLKGYPLEYTIDSGQFKMKMSANKVVKEKLDKKLFEVPEGYDMMTFEEFQKTMGAMGGG